MAPALEIDGLSLGFGPPGGPWIAVTDQVSLQVAPGEAVALVGESGCGKSVTAKALLRLLPEPPARVLAGQVRVAGRSVFELDPAGLRALRGVGVGFVFQHPMSALNPVQRVGDQVAERLRIHGGLSRRAARERAVALLAEVGIPAPAERARDHPHALSGGMRQRVVIAIALAQSPGLLIADEPTTALDVTVQAQIMRLIGELRARRGMAVLLITHDLGLVAQHVDRVVVMYAGQVVESAPVAQLFAAPRHPYTRGLLAAVPGATPGRLTPIPGAVPPPRDFPLHCRFADRCFAVQADCRDGPVPLTPTPVGVIRCHHPVEGPR